MTNRWDPRDLLFFVWVIVGLIIPMLSGSLIYYMMFEGGLVESLIIGSCSGMRR